MYAGLYDVFATMPDYWTFYDGMDWWSDCTLINGVDGAAGFTMLYSCMSVGSVLGALVMAQRQAIDLPFLLRASMGLAVTMTLLAAAPNLPLALVAVVLVGSSTILLVSGANALIQVEADAQVTKDLDVAAHFSTGHQEGFHDDVSVVVNLAQSISNFSPGYMPVAGRHAVVFADVEMTEVVTSFENRLADRPALFGEQGLHAVSFQILPGALQGP